MSNLQKLTHNTMKRRKFLEYGTLAGIALSLPSFKLSEKTKVLVLGGTNFVGPYVVKVALSKGWDITLFNRGVTNPHLFPGLKRIAGDRTKKDDVLKLANEKWDFVIDTWQGDPHAVKYTAEQLKGKTSHYAYVSSIAVYGFKSYSIVGNNEDTPLPTLPELTDDATELDYTKRKTYAENIIREKFPSTHTTYRAHMIFGTDVATGSLSNPELFITDRCYWPIRIDKGGDILIPGEGTDTVQYTDVKDLARFIISSIENKLNGSYNVFNTLTMKEYFDSLMSIKQDSASSKFIRMPFDFLLKNEMRGIRDIPMWKSHADASKGFYQFSNEKIKNLKFAFRQPYETFLETKRAFYRYHKDYDFADEKRGTKLARVEKELLEKWTRRLDGK